jgi:hypothetical protein
MVWSRDRKRFLGALGLFLAWVVALSALAVISAYRPAARVALPEQIPATSAPADAGDEKSSPPGGS